MSNLFLLDGKQWRTPPPLLTSNREESWSFLLLDKRDNVIEELDGVEDCSVSLNVNTEIRGSGRIKYDGKPVDWSRHRVQPLFTVSAGGRSETWPLGVFIPSQPSTSYGDAREPVELELFDKGHILVNQSSTASSYGVPAGAVVTDRIRQLLDRAGHRSAITDSTETLRTSMAWGPGTSYHRIVNDLLDAINYFSIHVDQNGVYRGDPYVRPQDRAPSYRFVDDAEGIYLPQFQHTADWFNVPNQVVLLSAVEGEEPALKSIATDDRPDSPFSYEATGIRRSHFEDNIEASSQAVLDAIAQRRLSELQRVTSTYSIEHLTVPMALNDAVWFENTRHGVKALATVQTMTLGMGQLCQTTLREVAS